MSQNPYEKIYDQLNINISHQTSFQEAEKLAVHLGYIYNTFGVIAKDFINILGLKFQSDKRPSNTKTDRRLVNEQAKMDRQNREKFDDSPNRQQQEGKHKNKPLNRLINQIKNYKLPGNKNHSLNQELLRQKLLKLKDHNNNSPNQYSSQSKLNEKQASLGSRRIKMKKKKDAVVISISSEDQQKMEDDSEQSRHLIKTRAQLRGRNRNHLMRNQNQSGKNNQTKKGRGKNRMVEKSPSKKKSSNQPRSDKNKSDHLDPFQIIYNVPYRPSERSEQQKQISMMSQSKKQQKQQKRQDKQQKQRKCTQNQKDPQRLLQANSQQYQQIKGMSKFNSTSFIKQVMQSYESQKRIKKNLQSLDKEYKRKVLNESSNHYKNEKIKEFQSKGDQDQYKDSSYDIWQNSEQLMMKSYLQSQEQNVGQHSQEEAGNAHEQQGHQQQQGKQLLKINVRQNCLNQINLSMQRQFEQNLRMNQEKYLSNQIDQEHEHLEYPANQIDQARSQSNQEHNQKEYLAKQIYQNQLQDQNQISSVNSQKPPKLVQQKGAFIITQKNRFFDSYKQVVSDNLCQNQIKENDLPNQNDNNIKQLVQNEQKNKHHDSTIQRGQKITQKNHMLDQEDQNSKDKPSKNNQNRLRSQLAIKHNKQEVIRILQLLQSSQQQNQKDNKVQPEKKSVMGIAYNTINLARDSRLQIKETPHQKEQIQENKSCPHGSSKNNYTINHQQMPQLAKSNQITNNIHTNNIDSNIKLSNQNPSNLVNRLYPVLQPQINNPSQSVQGFYFQKKNKTIQVIQLQQD